MAIWTATLLLLFGASLVSGRGPILRRGDSPTDACKRFSHQSTVVGNTVYIYGGQASTEAGQKSDRWNNNLLTLSLGEDWETTSPVLKGLPQPGKKGPPAVANGYLWHDGSGDNIYMYGGLFSDTPVVEPTAFSLWRYRIKDQSWADVTKDTKNSNGIQRSAEGAGATVSGRDLGYYFGGHLDGFTTEGWNQSTPRVYLKSLLEFDMKSMEFQNITDAGNQGAGFPPRADGVLLFIPWGKEGMLISIGGGTNETFQQMNIVDIYDLGTKKWTKQATGGDFPKYRVNPCAVAASASDGSSHNIYLWAGQNLTPYGSQTQYDDMWILTIPAFRWIKVDQDKQSVPPPRAGHSCELVGSQIVVIGGYSDELSCDSPGFYVFDASELQWKTEYSAARGGFTGSRSQDGISGSASRAYKVPAPVLAVIGGGRDGGATVTAPVKTAQSDSPVLTGDARQYKYTTFASISTSTTVVSSNAQLNSVKPKSGPNVGAIVGGVVGGVLLVVLLLFLGAWILYRRKIRDLRAAAAAAAISPGQGSTPRTQTSNGKEDSGLMLASELHRRGSSEEMLTEEPTFWGVLMSPRQNLRVVNH